MTEHEFLKNYNPDKYPKPSVTADILVFTVDDEWRLQVLLIKRGGHPFLGKWALPGGFVGVEESLEEAARRELKEETGLEGIYQEQLYTFGNVGRDPRMRVISVAYIALVPKNKIVLRAGDDAKEAELFQISMDGWKLKFTSAQGITITKDDLAFDHKDIIQRGLERLAGKLNYTDIAFELLRDKSCFSVFELQKIHEAIQGRAADRGNFWKMFKARYVSTGLVEELDKTTTEFSRREAKCYGYRSL